MKFIALSAEQELQTAPLTMSVVINDRRTAVYRKFTEMNGLIMNTTVFIMYSNKNVSNYNSLSTFNILIRARLFVLSL